MPTGIPQRECRITRLETDRLVLRAVEESDVDFLTDLMGDPEVMRFFPAPRSRVEVEDWLRSARSSQARDGFGHMLLLERATGRPLGRATLSLQLVHGVTEPEVGYMLRRDVWGQGYATEAARALRDEGFRRLNCCRIVAFIRPANEPSQGVARRLGMRLVDRCEHAGLEHLVFGIDRATWQARLATGEADRRSDGRGGQTTSGRF